MKASAVEVIGSGRWDDQYRPTVAITASAREAAVAILTQMEWSLIAEEFDDDPLVFYGTDAWLSHRWVSMRRTENRLTAWLTSRMKVVHMCMTDGHENDDDIRWFNDCWAEDGEHEWTSWWTIDEDPRDFWSFAQMVAREGS